MGKRLAHVDVIRRALLPARQGYFFADVADPRCNPAALPVRVQGREASRLKCEMRDASPGLFQVSGLSMSVANTRSWTCPSTTVVEASAKWTCFPFPTGIMGPVHPLISWRSKKSVFKAKPLLTRPSRACYADLSEDVRGRNHFSPRSPAPGRTAACVPHPGAHERHAGQHLSQERGCIPALDTAALEARKWLPGKTKTPHTKESRHDASFSRGILSM